MPGEYHLRPITLDDAEATRAIYSYYVENTIISFEYETPSPEDWIKKITYIIEKYPWLVCEHEGKIVGYAYGSQHRARTAYSWSAESTIYVQEGYHGRGIGKTLYAALFDLLRLQGYVNVYAGVGLPNEKSERAHEAAGFNVLGTFSKIGFKFGAWHDTKWYQLHLQDRPVPAPVIIPTNELVNMPEFETTMRAANENLNQKIHEQRA
jgi:phosphinothricin acetyltransferase